MFLEYFETEHYPVDQNAFLPGTCNAFCVGAFGALALAVRKVNLENANDEINSDDPLEPFQTKSWSYIHFRMNDSDCKKVARMKKRAGPELKKRLNALTRSVRGKRRKAVKSGGDCVQLSGIAKRHFKKLGYTFNKVVSEPRSTVFDKVTPCGNIIRITADAGGLDELIPYIDVRFIGESYISPEAWSAASETITTEDDLRAFLERHVDDVRYYEEHIAGIYDRELGMCHPTITRLLQEQRIRQIK